MRWERYFENAFILSSVIVVAGIAALFAGRLAGAEFVALCGVMSTVYGAAQYAGRLREGGRDD